MLRYLKEASIYILHDILTMTFSWQKRMRQKNVDKLYKESILELVDILEELNLTYWFTEGTLIWMLRYGTNHPSDINDVVDDDIDVMIEMPSIQAWHDTYQQIAKRLKQRGWGRLKAYASPDIKGLEPNKLKGWKLYGSPIFGIGLDCMMYVREPAANTGRVHQTTNEGHFINWDGDLPMDLIHPRKKVNCYGRPVYAPNNAEEILENWKGGEYDQDKLAYPLRPITQSEKEIIDAYSMKLAAQGYSTFKQ